MDEMDMVLPPVECVCHARAILDKREDDRRLVQFLLGLNDGYDHARSQILMIDPLPTVDKAYSMIVQVEDEKAVHESMTEKRGQMVMYMHKQRGYNGGYSGSQPRGYQGERRLSKEEKKKLRCNHCKESGHEMHECFKLHGYPEWYKRYKENRGNALVNYVGESHSEEDTISRNGEKYEVKQQMEGSSQQLDVASLIQAEVARCVGNLGNLGGGNGMPRAEINFIHGKKSDADMKKDEKEMYDGYYAFSIIPSMEKTGWIIDSGANTHVCCDREMLQMAYRLEKVVVVHLPDGNAREVTMAGKVRVNQDIVPTDVLYVRGFTHNLLSVA